MGEGVVKEGQEWEGRWDVRRVFQGRSFVRRVGERRWVWEGDVREGGLRGGLVKDGGVWEWEEECEWEGRRVEMKGALVKEERI